MKKEQIRAMQDNGRLVAVHLLPNPAQSKEWILMFKERGGRSHFLVSEAEQIISFQTLETALDALRSVGFKRAEIMF